MSIQTHMHRNAASLCKARSWQAVVYKPVLYILGLTLGLFSLVHSTPAEALVNTDFLKAEGAPVRVAKALEKGLRKAAQRQGSYKLLPNPIPPGMAQLTLGCTLDTSACVQGLAKMRKAKIIFHLRVLPFGSKAKVIFRKLDGTTGKTLKVISYRFRRRKVKKALSVLSQRMFGSPAAARRTPPPVVRRVKPVVRRVKPVVRRVKPVVRRVEPVVRRVKPVVRRVKPVVRRVEPKVQVRRVLPPKRRVVQRIVKRTVPKKRVIARRTAPPKPSVPLVQRPSFWAWICVGVTVAAAGGVIAFGLDASSKSNDITELIRRSKQGENISYKTHVQPIEKQGQSSAVAANVFIGVAALAAGASVVLFLLPPPKAQAKKTTQLPVAKSSTFAKGTMLFQSGL